MLLNDSDSGNLSYGLRFCISNKLSGDVRATGTRTTLKVARFSQNDVHPLHQLKQVRMNVNIILCNVAAMEKKGTCLWPLPQIRY